MIKKSLLVLLCAIGLTLAPEVKAFPGEEVARGFVSLVVAWEVFSLYRTHYRVPKPDKKKRPFVDASKKLYKKDASQWRKNVWNNLVIFQEDWVEGQAFKDTYFKRKGEDLYGSSKRKCFPFGFNGNLLIHLYTMNKTAKSVGELSFFTFAGCATIATIFGYGPKAPDWLNGTKRLKAIFEVITWEKAIKMSDKNLMEKSRT